MCAGVGLFYLATPLDCPEYMRIPIVLVPQEFIDTNNLANTLASKIKNGYIYMNIVQGMYGLPQAGILATGYDYYELDNTPGIFTHKTRAIWFTLVCDDFGVNYIGNQHAEHLMSFLKEHYDMEED